jgi:hypothetical protein
MRELALLDGEHQHRPRAEVDRHRALVFERPVQVDRLVEQLVDPGRRLAEQEPPVPPRGARAETAPVDDEDVLARLCEETRRRAAGDARSDDDGVRGA